MTSNKRKGMWPTKFGKTLMLNGEPWNVLYIKGPSMAKVQEKVKRPSKSEQLTQSVADSVAHLSTESLMRQLSLRRHELDLLEDELFGIQAKLALTRIQRGKVEAVVKGIEEVIGKR